MRSLTSAEQLAIQRLVRDRKDRHAGKLHYVRLADLLALPDGSILSHSEPEVHARKQIIQDEGIFDEAYYRAQFPDRMESVSDMLEHYVTIGWTLLKDPHPLFSTFFYLWRHRDVAEAKIEPFTHYIESGSNELRDPHPLILSPYCQSCLPATAEKKGGTWLKYICESSDADIKVHPAFSLSEVRSRLSRNEMSVGEFLRLASRASRDAVSFTPFFDPEFYIGQFDGWIDDTNPYLHYSTFGVSEGLSPCGLFDTSFYKSSAGIVDTILDPIIHFLWKGERNGHSPHFFYDPSYYARKYHEGMLDGAFWDFITRGVNARCWPNRILAETKKRFVSGDLIRGFLSEESGGQCERLLDAFERQETNVFRSQAVSGSSVKADVGIEAAYREYPGRKARQSTLPNVMLVSHFCGEHMFGSERSFLDMADAVSRLPANLTIILPKNVADYTNTLREFCTRAVVFAYDWWRNGQPIDESVVNLLVHIIQDDCIDLVHVNTLMLREPAVAARRLAIPVITHVREMVSQDQALCDLIGEDCDTIIDDVQGRSDWIIANSSVTARQFTPHDRTMVVPNTVDFKTILSLCKDVSGSGDLRVGLISSNMEKKGVLDFVCLAQAVEDVAVAAKFFLIGPPTALTRQLEEARSRGELPTNFLMSGYVANPGVAIADLDVVVNFSHFAESFGRTVLEAMAAKRVVVCYAWGALTELVDQGSTGFLVPYRQPEAAVPYIKMLTEDRDILRSMGAAAEKKAQYYGQDQFRERMADVYRQVFAVVGDKRREAPIIKASGRWKNYQEAPLRIAYFCWHFPVPSETFVLSELRHLISTGQDVIVFCKQSPHEAFAPDFAIRFERITSPDHLAQRLQETGRTVMHAHFAFPTVTKMVWPACEKAKIPFTFIAHAQDIFVTENETQLQLPEICASKYCLKAFTLSRYHYDYIVERGFAREKLSINPNAVDSDRFPLRAPRSFKIARKVVAVHRFVRKKGLELLIKAASLLEDLSLTIEIYGYGALEDEYKELIATLGLENVMLMGALPAEKVIGVMEQADLFVSPCVQTETGDMDGIPTSVVESMLAGVPVLTTAVSGIPDLVVDGITGLLCEPNAAAVAAGIRRFYETSDNRLALMVEEGRKRAYAHHDSKRCVDVLTRVWSAKSVDVVIVAWNNLTELQLVVDRILAYTTLPLHLIVCDNRSRKEPVLAFLDEVWAADDRVTVVQNSVNAMVGPATNLAVGQGTSDVVIYVCGKEGIAFASGWELPFVRAFEVDAKVGLVGTIGSSPSYLTGAQYPKGIKLFEAFRNKDFASDNPDRIFAHVQGGLFALRRKMFDEIGGFSEAVPHDYTDVEYSFFAESCGWTLGEAAGVLALFNKTRPTLSQRFDENVVVAHPVRPEQIATFEAVRAGTLRHCNICDWYGPAFSKAEERHCPDCLASASDRTLFRWLSESPFMYRRLVALRVGLSSCLSRVCTEQFQGPSLSFKDFVTKTSGGGRLPNRPKSAHLALVRLPNHKHESLDVVAKELRRLLDVGSLSVIQLPGSDQDDWEVCCSNLVDAMRASGHKFQKKMSFASSATALNPSPLLTFSRLP